MTLRDKFEARYPCPEGVRRTESGYEPMKDYSNCTPEDIKSALFQKEHADIQTARWEAYQAAMEDAVPDTSDADTIQLIYDNFLSIKRCGTWFLVTQGDKDIQLSYELNLKDAVDKAVKELNTQ